MENECIYWIRMPTNASANGQHTLFWLPRIDVDVGNVSDSCLLTLRANFIGSWTMADVNVNVDNDSFIVLQNIKTLCSYVMLAIVAMQHVTMTTRKDKDVFSVRHAILSLFFFHSFVF